MITKWIQFTVEPDRADHFREALAQLEIASKAERGCRHYAAFRDTSAADVFTVLESWESAEAFEAHRVSAHVGTFKAHCGEMILHKSGQSLDAVTAS